jgi:hypothetical protein
MTTMRSDDKLLADHIAKEEANAAANAERMERIEADLRPLRAMYYAVIGAGGVASMLLATLLYIYTADKGAITEMQMSIRQAQEAIIKQGGAMEKLLLMHQELERDVRRDVERVEKSIERVKR